MLQSPSTPAAVEECFRGAVVAVTGATGFIGSQLAARLCQLGAQVHGIARSKHDLVNARYRSHELDLRDHAAVKAAIESIAPDFVFHLAGHVTGATGLQHVIPAFESNLASTVHLLTACAETGCGARRIVLTGSLVEPSPDELETVPGSAYAAAKWASASYARMFHALYGLPTNVARVFMVYGPGQRDETKLVPYVVRTLLSGQAPGVTSGQRLIDWIHVTDVVEGFLAIASTPGIEGQSIDLGSGQVISTMDLVLKISALIGGPVVPRFGALPDRPMEPCRIADVARAFDKTGWRPGISLDEGLSTVVAYYRKRLQAR
jgi:UDP-glucose 4-epimerase